MQELRFEWIFPKKAHDMFLLEPGLPNRRKIRFLWFVIVHCIFWSVWLERNNRIFNDLAESNDEFWEKIKFRVAIWTTKLKEFNHFLISDIARDWKFLFC